MPKHSKRLKQHLQIAQKLYPHSLKMIRGFRAASGDSIPQWPEWCFLPLVAWHPIVFHDADTRDQRYDVARLAALETWRFTQGIYQLSPALQAQCFAQGLSAQSRSSQLQQLPDWCVYLNTPELNWGASTLYGFFAHLDWDPRNSDSELRLLMDTESGLLPFSLSLNEDTLEACVARALGSSTENAPNEHLASTLRQLLAFLLCLCREELLITDASGNAPRPRMSSKEGKLTTPAAVKEQRHYTVWQPGNAQPH